MRASTDYTRLLGALEREAFEEEVCAFLQKCILDFQPVVAKPHGDAGLDGLSHSQSRAYCCYGPEQVPIKKKISAGLRDDIVKKFRGDMLTLFELQHKRRKLIHFPTKEMPTILAPGRKILHLYLIVSVLETHQVIGPLNQSFEEYKKASKGNYVGQTATMVIWGPKELTALGPIDEYTLCRVEQQALVLRLKKAVTARGLTPTKQGDFDDKFDWLDRQSPGRQSAVQRLRKHFREAWSTAIAVEQELANTSVAMHESLGQLRAQVAVDADLKSAYASSPFSLLAEMRAQLRERIGETFGSRVAPETLDGMVDGEIASLIGECPLDWRN